VQENPVLHHCISARRSAGLLFGSEAEAFDVTPVGIQHNIHRYAQNFVSLPAFPVYW